MTARLFSRPGFESRTSRTRSISKLHHRPAAPTWWCTLSPSSKWWAEVAEKLPEEIDLWSPPIVWNRYHQARALTAQTLKATAFQIKYASDYVVMMFIVPCRLHKLPQKSDTPLTTSKNAMMKQYYKDW